MPSVRNEYYPLIIFPKYYEEIRNKELKFSDLFPDTRCPQKPANSEAAYLNLREEYKRNDFVREYKEQNNYRDSDDFSKEEKVAAYVIMGFIILGFIEFGQGLSDNLFLILFWMLIIACVIFMLFAPLIKLSINRNRRKSIDKQIYEKKYNIKLTEQEIKIAKEDYQKEMNKYDKQYPIYNKNYQNFNNREFINNYKNNLLKETYLEVKNNILYSSKIITNDAPKKGITEDYFHDYLINRPEFEVYKSLKFNYYYPDLALLHKDTNIFIDLEIDEPYSFEEKKPIHFDGSDDKRNDFFSENGFLVIRFTEDQIINHTYVCYAIIKKCVAILNDFISAGEFIGQNEECQKIKAKAWTYEEAFNMAYKHSRKDIADLIEKKVKTDNAREHELKVWAARVKAAEDVADLAISD